jgi:hypothetical protein
MAGVEEVQLSIHDEFGYISSHYNLDGRTTPIIEWLNPSKFRHIRLEVEYVVYIVKIKKLKIYIPRVKLAIQRDNSKINPKINPKINLK